MKFPQNHLKVIIIAVENSFHNEKQTWSILRARFVQRNSDEKDIKRKELRRLIKHFNISSLNIIRYALIGSQRMENKSRVIIRASRGQCGAVHRAHVRLLRLTGHKWDAPEMQRNETRKTESEREKRGTRATAGQTLPVYISTPLLWGTVPLENTKITKI